MQKIEEEKIETKIKTKALNLWFNAPHVKRDLSQISIQM